VRPNFRQRRIVAFTAACCHAKSTPLALRCSERTAATHRSICREAGIRLQQGLMNGDGTGGTPAELAPA
jgi:hypothetical protein